MPFCIYCGEEITEGATGSDRASLEHVIQLALGGKNGLATTHCHRRCNSGLGETVDSDFINQPIIGLYRQQYGLPGHGGTVPDVTAKAFAVGSDRPAQIQFRTNGNVRAVLPPEVSRGELAPGVRRVQIGGDRIQVAQILRGIAEKEQKKGNMLWSADRRPITSIEDEVAAVQAEEMDRFRVPLTYDLHVANRAFLKIAIGFAHIVFGDDWSRSADADRTRALLRTARGATSVIKRARAGLGDMLLGERQPGVWHRLAFIPGAQQVTLFVSLFNGHLPEAGVALGGSLERLLSRLPEGSRFAVSLNIENGDLVWRTFEEVLFQFAKSLQDLGQLGNAPLR